jgi:hypothetical protein
MTSFIELIRFHQPDVRSARSHATNASDEATLWSGASELIPGKSDELVRPAAVEV